MDGANHCALVWIWACRNSGSKFYASKFKTQFSLLSFFWKVVMDLIVELWLSFRFIFIFEVFKCFQMFSKRIHRLPWFSMLSRTEPRLGLFAAEMNLIAFKNNKLKARKGGVCQRYQETIPLWDPLSPRSPKGATKHPLSAKSFTILITCSRGFCRKGKNFSAWCTSYLAAFEETRPTWDP